MVMTTDTDTDMDGRDLPVLTDHMGLTDLMDLTDVVMDIINIINIDSEKDRKL